MDYDSAIGSDSPYSNWRGQGSGLDFRAMHFLSVELSNLNEIMTEQTELLRRIEARQASGDLSRKPMSQVPATSSSAWNPLLKNFISETIQPKVDRWRNGLDSLLVFLGLFSAIVTSFLVDSLSALTPDETARTNELLANLTDIVILLSGQSPSNLTISHPLPFEPDARDIRVNSFYSLSLVLSLSIAALVVAGRGFLNMVTWSHHKKAALRLSDVHKRWAAAERVLRPAIESLPQLLVIPVLLFIAAIVDVLLSTVLVISPRPTLIFVTTSLCLISIITVASVLCATFLHGGLNPTTSPFQSSLASLLRTTIINIGTFFFHHTNNLFDQKLVRRVSPTMETQNMNGLLDTSLFSDATSSYHEIVQGTHDDDALNLAASALLDILTVPGVSRRAEITDLELKTFIHLLSPEASIRSNRTAAEVFSVVYGRDSWISRALRPLWIHSLMHSNATTKTTTRDCLSLICGTPPFTHALAVVVGYRTCPIHPVVYIASAQVLNWESWSAHPESMATKEKLLRLAWQVLDIKLTKVYLQDVDIATRQAEMHALIYTSTPGDWVEIDSCALLESLIFLFHHGNLDQYPWITDFVRWVAGWASLDVLIVDLLRTLHGDMLEQRWAYVSPLDSLAFVDNFPRTLIIACAAIEGVQHRLPSLQITIEYRMKLVRVLADIVKINDWISRMANYHSQDLEGDLRVILQHMEAEKPVLGDIEQISSAPGISLVRPLRYMSFTRVSQGQSSSTDIQSEDSPE
ncbi:hypothetical protein MSAN_01232000 [Mycena sanguinolenta]|uniref:DUF6535 domain-containing protein n=1 Tax=Mycena sanguinolenta TaxID=230812 RepID=A0A8H7D4S7_9AGAR|nr:hypothetical protein MSAN_01232000 [Mycena sanguinolenta]